MKLPTLTISWTVCILTCYRIQTVQGVQLSPSNVALVCPGEQLSLTCQANQSSALRWTITPPEGSVTYTRDVQTIGNLLPLPVEVAGRTITVYFSRQSVDPLTSTLSINSTSTNLNRTRINCSTGDSSAMTVLNVIGPNYYHLSPEQISKMGHFGTANYVIVALEWTPVDNVAYSVSIVPPTDFLFSMNKLWNVMSYNTSYSVNIQATYCGYINITTLMLEYVTCESIISKVMESIYDPALQVKNMNYVNRPALSGDRITFQCSSGLILVGPSSSTCIDDGQWVPDPRELKCVNMSHSTASSYSPENVTESRTMSTVAVAISSSVIAFLITSIVIFITGFACGHCFSQKFKQSSKEIPHPTDYSPSTSCHDHPIPLYEEVQSSAMKHQQQGVEVNENVAYGPSMSTIARHQ